MNKKTSSQVCCVAALLLVGNVASSFAVPFGSSNLGYEHLVGTAALPSWSIGVTASEAERTIDGIGTMEHRRVMGYLGYDITRFWTAYATIADARYSFGGGPDTDGDFEYGVGTAVNLIDQHIYDPTLFENRLRLNANVLFTQNQAEGSGLFGVDRDWNELTARLTLSIVNDIEGNKYFSPMSIAVFGGGVYSQIFGGDNMEDDDDFGYMAGIEIYYSSSVSLDLTYEELDDSGFSAGVHVRF